MGTDHAQLDNLPETPAFTQYMRGQLINSEGPLARRLRLIFVRATSKLSWLMLVEAPSN